MPAAMIGILLALATAVRIVVSPAAGLVADARDDRRLVMLFLTALAFLAFVLFAFARTPYHLFVWGVAATVLWISVSPIMESATLRAAESAGVPYGSVRVWLSIAFVAGNVLSGFAIAAFGFGIVAPWFAVCAAMQLCAIYALPKPPSGHATGSFALRLSATIAEARELMAKPVFLLFLVACSLIQGSHSVYYTYAGLAWREQGLSAATIGILWPVGVLAEIALFAFSAHVVRRISAMALIAIGAAACALRWTIMAFDPGLPYLVPVQFLHGFTFAVPHLGAMYFILRATPPRLSATAQSLYSVLGVGLGSSLSLVPASYLYAQWGSRVYLLMSVMAVAAAGLVYLLGRRWNGGRLTENPQPAA
jgi:PPP family 3-phenylpropionic acid transporter